MTIDDKTKAEKARLLAEGFGSWNRPNFRSYCNAVERFGRASIEEIANNVAEVTGKAKADVYRYHSVFWKRYKEVEGWEKIVEKVEKGEQKIARREVISNLLKRKLDRCVAQNGDSTDNAGSTNIARPIPGSCSRSSMARIAAR